MIETFRADEQHAAPVPTRTVRCGGPEAAWPLDQPPVSGAGPSGSEPQVLNT